MKKGMHKLFSTITCLVLCMSFFLVPVKAESDILYPDPDNYSAYDYFFNHGYNHLILTSNTNITYNVNLDNVGSNDGSITGTNNMTGSSHNTGTINSSASTLGSKYMTCTTNNAVSGTQTYSCYFSDRSSGVSNSQSITLKMNENTYSDYSNVDIGIHETINQDINTDITGSITSSTSDKSYIYLPWLTGTYTHHTSFTTSDYFYITSENDNWLIFLCPVYNNPTYNIYTQYGRPVSVESSVETLTGTMRLYKYHFTTTSSGEWITLDLPWLVSSNIMPIFYGTTIRMTDSIREFIGMDTKTNEILKNGNAYTGSIVENSHTAKNEVNNKISQFDTLENDSVNDMNNNISNLNITSDILSNSKFLSSAAWVKTQFDNLTVSTPIGSVLSFSLILGVALIFVGKYR